MIWGSVPVWSDIVLYNMFLDIYSYLGQCFWLFLYGLWNLKGVLLDLWTFACVRIFILGIEEGTVWLDSSRDHSIKKYLDSLVIFAFPVCNYRKEFDICKIASLVDAHC